jgi:predicted heme/steroid binding protein
MFSFFKLGFQNMRELTEGELAQYDGKNGNAAYIAYKGKVYDISASFLWKEGAHQVLHSAGVDLTDALEHAPHGDDGLEKFPVAGVLHGAGVYNVSSEP